MTNIIDDIDRDLNCDIQMTIEELAEEVLSVRVYETTVMRINNKIARYATRPIHEQLQSNVNL